MLPQFNTLWFGNQIFWFTISFSGFAILSSKVIIPFIVKFHKEREEKIKNIINQANQMVLNAEIIKKEIKYQLQLAQTEADVILHQAKKKCENDNSNFNQKAIHEIEIYRQQKNENINHEIIKKNLYLLNCINTFATSVAQKSGIKNFTLQVEKFNEIKDQLNI